MPIPADRHPLFFRSCRWLVLGFSLAAGPASRLHAQAASTVDHASVAGIDPHTWARLAGNGTAADLVARLRAIDCPPVIIRAIIFEQLRTTAFAEREREVCAAIETQFYWRTPSAMEPKLERLRRTYTRDLFDAVRAVLGPGADELSETERAVYRRQYGDLSPEKIDLMQRLLSDYRDLTKLAQLEAVGPASPTNNRSTLTLLERELRADLVKNFTPAELDGYDRRMSRAASTVRFELSPLAPTEAEFLAVYRLRQEFDDRRVPREQLLEKIAAALGPARYAEYQRANDPATRPKVPPRARLPNPAPPASPIALSRGPWATLESDDPVILTARLRAAGFPEDTVRVILGQRLLERQLARELQEIFDGDGHSYWLDEPGYRLDTREKQAASRRITREHAETVRQLFGVDDRVLNAIRLAYQRRIFGALSAEKISGILRILATLDERSARLLSTGDDSPQFQEWKKVADAEVAKLLTPDEFERFELRRGRVAEHLRHSVIGFSATVDEFEAVSRIYRPLAELLPSVGFPNHEQLAALTKAEEPLQPQLQAALGPERLADFQQARHGNRVLNDLIVHLDRPIAAARALAEIERDALHRVDAIRADGGLTPELRNLQLTELARKTKQQVIAAIGEQGLEVYQAYGGQWLANLAPKPSP